MTICEEKFSPNISQIFRRDGNHVHSFDGGFTYALKPNIQLDAFAEKGITENSFFLMGAGISFRIPK